MLSSHQISAIFAQQQQQFAAMQQYSQQISATMPQPYQGLGAQGLGYQSTPGAFNYGMPNAMGSYGPGNQVANAGLSAVGGGMPAMFAGASMLGGLGMLGRAGKVLDPFSMGMAGFRAAGVMGAVGGAALPLAAGAAISHIGSSMVQGGQEQAGIEQVLSRFQFQNAGSRTGRGFTRQDAMQIGNMVRELAHVPEMLTSVSELTKIMDRMGSMGLMNGVKDAQQFQTKFKETLGTIKDVARILGSTLEDAAGAFGEARRSGFYSQNDIVKNAINRQVTGGLTGMSQQQVGALQQYGSEMGFGTGGSRASGARNVIRTAQQLGVMNQTGMLSNDQIVELTGQEGAAGIQTLAAGLTEAGYKMSRSSLGTAMTLALGEVKEGKYTGKMDQALVERMRRGEIGKEELMRIAHQKAQGRDAKLSFAAHRSRLTSEMVGAVGIEGMSMELKGILGERGFDNPDALNLVMQKYGVDERTAEQAVSMGKMSGTGELQARQGMEAKRAARNAYLAENFSWDAIKKKIGKNIESVTTEPFKKIGANIRNSIATMMDDFIDDVTGHYSAQMSQGVQTLIRDAAVGKGGSRKTLGQLLSGPGPSSKFLGGSQVGGLAGELRSYVGGGLAGESQAGLAKALGFGSLVGNVSGAQGAAAMQGFERRLASQGTGALQKGHEAAYNDAKNQLLEILRSEEMEGKSDTERWDIIRGKIDLTHAREVGTVQRLTTSPMERLARATGMTPERAAAAIMAGDEAVRKMKPPSLAKIYGKDGDLPGTTEAIVEARKNMERELGGTASGARALSAVKSAMQNASLVGGGALMAALTKSEGEQNVIIDAIISGDFDKVKKYGITAENAPDALRLLRATAGAGKEKLLMYARLAAKETDSLMKEHLEERSLAARKLSKSSNKAIAAVGGSYAEHLAKGNYEAVGGDITALIKTISNIKDPAEREKAMNELSSSGNYELRAAVDQYKLSGGFKGKGKAGQALDAAIGKGADLLFGRSGGREGSSLASDEAVKSYFDNLNEHQSQIAQILRNIAAGNKPGEGLSPGKKPPQ